MHGRSIDAVHPFLRHASTTRDVRFVDAAVRLFRGAERLSGPDGSWLCERAGDSWPWAGTTVQASIALGEALQHHGEILDPGERDRWRRRLAAAIEFIAASVPISPPKWNVNYPCSASAALAVAAVVLDRPSYTARAREFAHGIRQFFTQGRLIWGEGKPATVPGPRGCRSIDLIYNVADSLPNLALYAKLTGDREIEDAVVESLRAHLEFMLPDGGWDASFGSRAYKWTYWGGRTTGACQLGLALLADRDGRFEPAAVRSLGLLERCTVDGLLASGSDAEETGERPCVQPTIFHARGFASLLDAARPEPAPAAPLPRDRPADVRHFAEIDTYLVDRGPWRSSITCYSFYDRVPSPGGGTGLRAAHASGGALSMLWHELAGPLVTSSLTDYFPLQEPGNMPLHRVEAVASLTPRLELARDWIHYRSIEDLAAQVTVCVEADQTRAAVEGELVTAEQKGLPDGALRFRLDYRLSGSRFEIGVSVAGNPAEVQYILPLICRRSDAVTRIDERAIEIVRSRCIVELRCDRELELGHPTDQRIYSPVPGHHAISTAVAIAAGSGEARLSLTARPR